MKIERAAKKNINESNDLPDVSSGVMMFFQLVKVDIVFKEQVNGYTEETKRCVMTQGVRQPFTSQQLAIKPEGERTWNWSKLYVLPNLKIKLDDIIKILGSRYRVMGQTDWAEYGYVEYELVEDFKHAE